MNCAKSFGHPLVEGEDANLPRLIIVSQRVRESNEMQYSVFSWPMSGDQDLAGISMFFSTPLELSSTTSSPPSKLFSSKLDSLLGSLPALSSYQLTRTRYVPGRSPREVENDLALYEPLDWRSANTGRMMVFVFMGVK